MSKQILHIAYDGPALATHEMDVRDLAPALLAFADMFDSANAILNGDKAKISVNVKGSFKTGSFGIFLDVTQDIIQTLINFASQAEIASAANIATLLGFSMTGGIAGVLQVLKWLRGRKISEIKNEDKDAKIFAGDQVIVTEKKVIELFNDPIIRTAIEKAITKPLEHKGIEVFAFSLGKDLQKLQIIDKSEAEYFCAPREPRENLGTTEYDTTLQIISVSFQDNNKWRFSDGGSTSFFADMEDKDFLAKIDEHEITFGKGDLIRAKIRETKILDPNGVMKAERSIIKVYEHRSSAVQLNLPE